VSVSNEMIEIAITEPGGPEVLKPQAAAVPQPGEGELLIKVAAAGVNRPDVLQREGSYPPPKGASPIPGLEVAGEVVGLGEGTNRFAPGDQVCALVNGGGYAEFCLAPEASTMAIPSGLELIEAAAIPETYFTVWHNVFERGRLQPGEWFLVHGGTSGIGTTAIQLAKAFGSKVIATAGSAGKCDACLELGADIAVNYREEDFVEGVKAATGGAGANVILDMVGGDYIGRNFKAAAMDGRIVQIAFLGGSKVETDFMLLMLKRLTLTGSTLRARSNEFKGQLAHVIEERVMPLMVEGKISLVMDSRFPLRQAADAHARMEEGQHIGKIMLTVE